MLQAYVTDEHAQHATGESRHFPSDGHAVKLSTLLRIGRNLTPLGEPASNWRQTQQDIKTQRTAAKDIPLMT